MYKHIIGLTLIDICRPYFRKHLLQTLNPREYLFLNTFFINSLLICYFCYIFINQKTVIDNAVIQYKKLSIPQICTITISSASTVVATIILLDFDKKYNTPAINNIITKTSSILLVFFIGYFVFRETYSMKQIVGIITMVTGMTIMIY
jgi:drug/metabolite transporter (DMT)-like permease